MRYDITANSFSSPIFEFAIHAAVDLANDPRHQKRMEDYFQKCFRIMPFYAGSVHTYFERAATQACSKNPNDALYDSINSILDGAKYIDGEFFLIVKKRIEIAFQDMIGCIDYGKTYEIDRFGNELNNKLTDR